jgi:hypothetical protein
MKPPRKFDPQAVLAAARSGELTGAALRKAIKTAEEFGLRNIAHELRLHVVQPASFAGDAAPPEVRERAAQGISALTAMGERLSRTKQMLKRHGLIETINRIAKYPAATKNFDLLCAAGLEHLTAEAIVIDYPEFFSTQAVEVARRRLGR